MLSAHIQNHKSSIAEGGLKDCLAVILAGGLGTRLRPVFDQGPKCMAPVGGRPFLDYLLRRVARAGIKHVVLCIGYLGEHIQAYFGDGSAWGLNLSYAIEHTLLGTAGAVKNAESWLQQKTSFVFNGDSFLDVDLAGLLAFHRVRKALLTIALARYSNPARYGRVLLDAGGAVTAFIEKDVMHPDSRESECYINGGVYVLSPGALALIPAAQVVSWEKDVFPRLLGAGLYGYSSTGYFIDIGVPADFQRAQTELVQKFG
jgi:NDP-sugar pyrophosphorylase family protein